MREILFRGKRLDHGEWVDGNLLYYPDVNRAYIQNGDYFKGGAVEVARATVGQYTGLKDKNGKRIFEGDIVTGLFLYCEPVNGVCAFRDGSFGLLWGRGGAEMFTPFTSMCHVEYEVIGNITDNTELIEGTGDG